MSIPASDAKHVRATSSLVTQPQCSKLRNFNFALHNLAKMNRFGGYLFSQIAFRAQLRHCRKSMTSQGMLPYGGDKLQGRKSGECSLIRTIWLCASGWRWP
jgi:hypothetical protein